MVLLLGLVLASGVQAQPRFSLTGYVIRDDNAFRSNSQTNDWINIFAFSGSQTWGQETWAFRLSYNGDYSRFAEYSERQNTSHQFGLGYTGAV